jgi:phage terminase large subunit
MEMTQSEKLQKCIDAGMKAGCPRDQVSRLVNAGYVPLPWQWLFHAAARSADNEDGPVDIGVGGARGPGKSHAVLSQVALDDCQVIPHLKVLFLRQTGIAAKESFSDLVDKVVRGHVAYRRMTEGLRFENGSQIKFGGFKTENDIDKYIGIEYDVIIVEELNQLSNEKYEKLRGSLRTSKPDWRPRMYTSFNPGGRGHQFVKERYVIPSREKTETKTRFIPSTYKSNPYLNGEYINYLEELSGDLGKAWREGEWELFAGQYFGEWRESKHVIKPISIPLAYPRFRSIDISGHSGYTSCHWYAVDNDGRVFVYKEYYATGRDYDEHAKEIYRLSSDSDGVQEDYRWTVIDNSANAKAGFSETPAEIYERNGVGGFQWSSKERIPGWTMIHTFLRWDEKTKPLLQIFSTCYNLIREIPTAQHDEKNPEDVESNYIGNMHWDTIDDLRYFLMTLRETKAPQRQTLVERKMAENIKRQGGGGWDYRNNRPL